MLLILMTLLRFVWKLTKDRMLFLPMPNTLYNKQYCTFGGDANNRETIIKIAFDINPFPGELFFLNMNTAALKIHKKVVVQGTP